MLNLEKLDLLIKKQKEISKTDIKAREVIELCSGNFNTITYEFLQSISYRDLVLAYDELYKKPLDKKEIIKDMINGQYLIENLSYIKHSNTIIDYDEEIY